MTRTLLGLDEVNVEVAAAMDHAEVELEDTIPLKEKNCRCKLSSGTHCIDQFPEKQHDDIRYSYSLVFKTYKCMFLTLHMFSLMKVLLLDFHDSTVIVIL